MNIREHVINKEWVVAYIAAYPSGSQRTTRHLMLLGANSDRASELAQDAWVRGWERLNQLDDPRRLVAWINAIAVNLLWDRVKSEKWYEPLSFEREPASSVVIDIRLLDLDVALNQCSAEDQFWLNATYKDGFSATELEYRTGIARGTIHAKVSRARRRLRERMDLDRQVSACQTVSPRKPVGKEINHRSDVSRLERRDSAAIRPQLS
jgi:RNA polymerase sigma-70 factor (ECF subfamily)